MSSGESGVSQEGEIADAEAPPGEVTTSLAALGSWLHDVRRATRSTAPKAPQAKPKAEADHSVVLYALQLDRAGSRSTPTLRPHLSRRRSDGGWGKPRKLEMTAAFSGQKPTKGVTLEDEVLWMRLVRLSPDPWRDHAEPAFTADADGSRLFSEFVETGRIFWESPDAGMVTLGSRRAGHLAWEPLADGTQRLTLRLLDEDSNPTGPAVLPMVLGTPYYLDVEARQVGPLDVPVPTETLASLISAPTLDPRAVEWLDDAHLDELEAFGLPLPRVQHWEEIVGVQPRPRLTLELDGPGGGLEALRVAAFFDYGPVSIPVDPQERLPSQRWSAGDVVYEVARDLEAELAALEPLAALGQAFAAENYESIENAEAVATGDENDSAYCEVEEGIAADAALMDLDQGIGVLWDAMPDNAMLILCTGAGDTPRVRTMQERKWKRSRGLGPWGPFTDEAEDELRRMRDRVSRGVVFAGVKQKAPA